MPALALPTRVEAWFVVLFAPMPALSRRLFTTSLLFAACRCASPTADTGPGASGRPPLPEARCPMPERADAEPDTVAGKALALSDEAAQALRWDEALACAQVAARALPDDASTHIARAAALDALGEQPLAAEAFQRAVALAPDAPEVLRASADFLRQRGGDDALETAVLHARRGRELSTDLELSTELAVVEAGALNLLGRSDEALQAAEGALALDDASTDGWLERGVALFERLRFDDARPCLERVRTERDDDPRAAWYLGLLEERRGDESRARRLFGEATRLDPEAYPPALALSEPAFDKLLHEEARRLDEAERTALETTELGWTDLPAEADLLAGDPVLSPTIVGLFRPGEEGRRDGIVLYRRNLLRISRTIEDLRREVRDTLRHELGHLRGEDDAELRDRGL